MIIKSLLLLIILLKISSLLALESLKRDPFTKSVVVESERKRMNFLLQGIAKIEDRYSAIICSDKKIYLLDCGDRCRNYKVKYISDIEVCLHNLHEEIILKLDRENIK